MGLRLDEGIDLQHIAERTGVTMDKLVDPRAVSRYAELGLIERQDNHLRVLGPGMLLLDALLTEIVAVG
jgi:oxygen-independent coproporphyrinogen-3 oxidase